MTRRGALTRRARERLTTAAGTGRVLLLLRGDRLLEIAAADGSSTPIDYGWPDLTDWMQAMNAAIP